jgi:phage-related protein
MSFFSGIVSTISHVVSQVAEPVMAIASPTTFFGSAIASGVLKGVTPALTSMASEVLGAVQPFAAALGSFANLNLGGTPGGDVSVGGAKSASATNNSNPGSSSSSLQAISTPYSGLLSSIDQQEQSLTSQLNNPNMTPTQLLSLQDQISKVNMMLQLISQIMAQDTQTKEAIIHNT